MSKIVLDELEIQEEEFANISHRQLVSLFEKHKKITVRVGHKNRLDLTYVDGFKHGIKYTELVNLLHVERLPSHYTDEDDDERFKTITDKLLSPLSFSRAVKTFHSYYKKLKVGKVMKIKDLSEEELDRIIVEMNRPLPDQE